MSTTYTGAAGLLSSTDITDSIARQLYTATTPDSRCQVWLDRAEYELQSIAQEKGVPPESIAAPLHYKCKEYALSYLCFIIFQDIFTSNNVQVAADEKHRVKLDWYQARCDSLRGTITAEMLLLPSSALSPASRVGAGVIWRG